MSLSINGIGIWIWNISACDGGNWDKIIARCQTAGINWILIKCGESSRNTQWQPATAQIAIDKCHAAGLKIGGWNYSRPATYQAEVELITSCVAQGLDFWILDPEIEWQDAANNKVLATNFMQALRAKLGNDFTLAYAPFAIPQFHTSYPYREFHQYASFCATQLYWTEFDWSLQKAITLHDEGWAAFNKANQDVIIPIYAIGNTYGSPYPGVKGVLTAADLQTFLTHYKGLPISLYSYDAATGFPTWGVLDAMNGNESPIATTPAIPAPITPPEVAPQQIAVPVSTVASAISEPITVPVQPTSAGTPSTVVIQPTITTQPNWFQALLLVVKGILKMLFSIKL